MGYLVYAQFIMRFVYSFLIPPTAFLQYIYYRFSMS